MKLDENQRGWLVAKWATYCRPLEILRDFEATFGARLHKDQAKKYDLTGIRTEEEAKKRGLMKWMPVFQAARKAFEDSIIDIPIANSAYRIRKLDEMFDVAFERKNYKSAAQLLEQAAKETGGVFSNRRTLEGALEHHHNLPVDDTPEDVKRDVLAHRIRDAVAAALAQGDPRAEPSPTTTH